MRGVAVCSLLLLVCRLYAKGADEVPFEPLNPEWTFAVTEFDVSALPPENQFIGQLARREILTVLKDIQTRRRTDEEYTYYEEVGWSKIKAEAAKNIADKQAQRGQLVYQGDAQWRYRRSLKTIDTELETLRESYEQAAAAPPPIAVNPTFILADAAETILKPPAAGKESHFCRTHKLDGFLSANATLYHGRIYLTVKIYTLFDDAYSYENTALFSPDNYAPTLKNLSFGLSQTLSGAPSAVLAVKADPPSSSIFINGSLVGTGEVSDYVRPPGETHIAVMAEGHESVDMSVKLYEGEHVEAEISLPPFNFTPLSFDVLVPKPKRKSWHVTHFAEQGASVYQGALFMGRAPLTIEIPDGQLSYFRFESDQVAGDDGILPRKTAGSIVVDARDDFLTIKTRALPLPNENPVEKARNRLYLSYGIFWLTLPFTMVIGFPWNARNGTGFFSAAYNNAYYHRTPENVRSANRWYNISIGATTAMFVALGWSIANTILYFVEADKASPELK